MTRVLRLPRRGAALAAAALVCLAVAPASALALPSSVASLGDSITRGFNTEFNFSCLPPGQFFVNGNLDCPRNSWSTGDGTAVNSILRRIDAANGLAGVTGFNDALTGARMSALQGQASAAVSQHPDLVTILMGANDACAPTIAQMTPLGTFGSQFKAALDTLHAGLPNAKIYVGSIPNIATLRELFKNDPNALGRWQAFHICQALLANPQSDAPADVSRRAQFTATVIAYNLALAIVCRSVPNCVFDNGANFLMQFTAPDVSTLATNPPTGDYFHPSIAGQNKLAATAAARLGL